MPKMEVFTARILAADLTFPTKQARFLTTRAKQIPRIYGWEMWVIPNVETNRVEGQSIEGLVVARANSIEILPSGATRQAAVLQLPGSLDAMWYSMRHTQHSAVGMIRTEFTWQTGWRRFDPPLIIPELWMYHDHIFTAINIDGFNMGMNVYYDWVDVSVADLASYNLLYGSDAQDVGENSTVNLETPRFDI